jgi:pSer/pThr/pTyr-binding forkhead associated (FHA) protein
MIRCPRCQVEAPSTTALCPVCRGELAPGEEPPTLRTKPKLLVVRAAPKPPATRKTDHDVRPQSTAVVEPAHTPIAAPPRLRVVRGLKIHAEYPLYDGRNLIGRGDDEPVDIDLRDQEPRDRVWASRHHAVITLAAGVLTLEDLNSMNGTYVNRHRVNPGQKRALKADDIVQIGTIQMKLTL